MKSQNNNSLQEISWPAEEFKHQPKSFAWFIGFTIVSIALVVYAVFSKSVMTIIAFVLLITVAYLYAVKNPRILEHKITKTGIKAGNNLYPYKNIKKFWIVYQPPEVKTLNIETTAYLNNEVTIQLGNQDPVAVKLALRNYVPEDIDKEESLTDALGRKLKFWFALVVQPRRFGFAKGRGSDSRHGRDVGADILLCQDSFTFLKMI